MCTFKRFSDRKCVNGVLTHDTNRSIRVHLSKVDKFKSPESDPEFVGGCGGDVCCGGDGLCPDDGCDGGLCGDDGSAGSAGSAGSDPSESV